MRAKEWPRPRIRSRAVAAIDTLKAGGTAADAAVAAVAVLCVVEPAMTGIGGDCFCLVAKPDAPVWGYNGSGRAAAAVTTEKLLAKGVRRKIAATSPHAVTVPGAIEAWEAILKAHGRFGLDRALQPAIRHAEDGFRDRAARRLRLGGVRRQAQAACRLGEVLPGERRARPRSGT